MIKALLQTLGFMILIAGMILSVIVTAKKKHPFKTKKMRLILSSASAASIIGGLLIMYLGILAG